MWPKLGGKRRGDIHRANIVVREAVALIKGHLKSSGAYGGNLAELKKELKDFNAKTLTWNDK